MEIWSFDFAAVPPLLLAGDRATVQRISGDKIRLEVTARKGTYAVEITGEEIERIRELLGSAPRDDPHLCEKS